MMKASSVSHRVPKFDAVSLLSLVFQPAHFSRRLQVSLQVEAQHRYAYSVGGGGGQSTTEEGC